MVADRNGVFDVTLSILELEQDDAGKLDVRRRRKVECKEEGDLVLVATQNPILLVFSVRDLAAAHLLVTLHLHEGLADWGSDKVALKLSNFGGDLFDSGRSLSTHLFVAGTNSYLFLLRHALLDFLGLWEVTCADG